MWNLVFSPVVIFNNPILSSWGVWYIDKPNSLSIYQLFENIDKVICENVDIVIDKASNLHYY